MAKRIRKTANQTTAQVDLDPSFDELRQHLEVSLAADRAPAGASASAETPNSEAETAIPSSDGVGVPPSTDTVPVRSRKRTSTDPLAELLAKAAEIANKPKSAKTPKAKTPKECLCGCGEMTRGGAFKPGHDSRVLSREIARLRAAQVAPTTVQ